ncbi:hypothetical protein D3C75_1375240 [compost metagenome]
MGTYSAASIPFYAAVLVIGWYVVRGRVYGIANGKLKFDENQELVSTTTAEANEELAVKPTLKEAQ